MNILKNLDIVQEINKNCGYLFKRKHKKILEVGVYTYVENKAKNGPTFSKAVIIELIN